MKGDYMIIVTVLNIRNGIPKETQNSNSINIDSVFTVNKMERLIPAINSYMHEHGYNMSERIEEYDRIVVKNEERALIFRWFSDVYNYC